MNPTSFMQLYVFVLAAFVGYQVITRVPPLLHTPLMSATNAISAHLAGRLAGRGRRQPRHGDHRARLHRGDRGDHQRRRRLPHHRPHAEDVQAPRRRSPRPARRWRRRPEERGR